MFSFAIWDRVQKHLFCARDFFGIKPFYYTIQNNQFIFASEIKSILEHPAYERSLNRTALEQYLSFQFSSLDETFFKGIFKLPAGHYAIVKEDGSFDLQRYWRPVFHAESNRTFSEAVDYIDRTFRESVRYHNVADVEVGSFLSSGIDSSYMAACLAKENPGIKTFTVGFSEYEGERDEVSWGADLARRLQFSNTRHYISQEEYWDALPLIQWHMDEPSGDPSAIALYFVDQLASKSVKAVLSGEGADELFGGYKIYQAPLAARALSAVPAPLLKAAASFFKKTGLRGANYLERASESASAWYYTNANGVAFTKEERERLLKDPLCVDKPQSVVAPAYAEAIADNLDEPTQMQYVDILHWLVGDILLKTDKMSMAHSLESRVPFLDKEVFEAAASLPLNYRVTPEQTKVALRQASRSAIPQDWADKEKLGFPVPMAAWMREQENFETIEAWFAGPEAQLFFKESELFNLLQEHLDGADRSRKIFMVWMFLIWYRIYFIDQKKPVQ